MRHLLRDSRVGAPEGFKERAFDVALQALAAPTVAAGAAATSKGLVAAASKVAALTNVHWIGVACLVGVCTAGGVLASRSPAKDVPKPTPAIRLALTPSETRRTAAVASDWSPVAVDLTSLPLVPPPPSASLAPPTVSPIQAAPSSETRVLQNPRRCRIRRREPVTGARAGLDLARRAIAAGDSRAARSRSFTTTTPIFPNGALRPEGAMLRVEALLAAGRRADATRLGLAEDPRRRAGQPLHPREFERSSEHRADDAIKVEPRRPFVVSSGGWP